MSEDKTERPKKRRGLLMMSGVALLLVGVVVIIVKLIESAPTAAEVVAGNGEGGDMPEGPPPAAVYVALVEAIEAQEEAVVTGMLRAVSRAEVAAQEAEAVAEVLVDEGDAVEAGAVLVRLDERRIQTQIAEAAAQLQSAEELVTQRTAELKRARADHEMDEALLKDKAISKSEFLDAERTLIVTEALQNAASQAVVEVKSRVELLEIRRNDLEIKAPFAGIITARLAEPGEWVGAGQAVMALVTVEPVEAWLDVPERYLGDLSRESNGVRIRLSSSGEIFEPSKVAVVPDVEPRSQLFTVVATLGNPGGRLAPGRSITGVVPVGEREDHRVFPIDALVRAPTGNYVFIVDAAEEAPLPVAKKVPVKLHFERGEMAFVRAADAELSDGDQVVVEGNDRLQPGQPLMVRETGDAAGAPTKM